MDLATLAEAVELEPHNSVLDCTFNFVLQHKTLESTEGSVKLEDDTCLTVPRTQQCSLHGVVFEEVWKCQLV